MIYQLRRETIKDDTAIFMGTENQCIEYMNDIIERNKYKDTIILTDIYMKPVWDTGKAAYYLSRTNLKWKERPTI